MKKVTIATLFSLLMAVPALTFGQTDAADSEAPQSPNSNKSVMQGNTNQEKMNHHILTNTKYPADAKKAGVEGKVFVSFVVAKDGSIKDVKVIQGVNKSLDAEALRVVKSMPKWTPEKVDGKAADVSYTIPVMFKL